MADRKIFRKPDEKSKKKFTPPPSAGAESYSEMLEKQREETIAAVVLSETYPDSEEYKKDKERRERDKKDR